MENSTAMGLSHAFASFLVNSGRTLYEVAQTLAHTDTKMTARYAHVSRKTLQDVADTASAIILRATKRAA